MTFTSAAQLCRSAARAAAGMLVVAECRGTANAAGRWRRRRAFVGRVTRVVSGNGRNFCFVAVPSKNVEIYCPLNRLHRNHAFDAVRNGDAIAGSLQPSRVKPGTFEALEWGPAPPGAAEG